MLMAILVALFSLLAASLPPPSSSTSLTKVTTVHLPEATHLLSAPLAAGMALAAKAFKESQEVKEQEIYA